MRRFLFCRCGKDNREESYDSRYEEIGPVHKDMIDSRAILRIWPLDEFGTLD